MKQRARHPKKLDAERLYRHIIVMESSLFSAFSGRVLKHLSGLSLGIQLVALVGLSLLLGGCATTGSTTTSDYHVTAYAPVSRQNVAVKVSLQSQTIYVEEGDKVLLATPTCVGRSGFTTPTGHFTVIDKIADKRSSVYGYWVNGSKAFPGKSSQSPGPGWHYVGYPLANWVEFTPGYGFHEGPVWPMPRSHGCLHVHPNASAKFFKLVEIGTPVIIENSLPEDATVGRTIDHPGDYADPDPAPSLMTSNAFFANPRESSLVAGAPPKI